MNSIVSERCINAASTVLLEEYGHGFFCVGGSFYVGALYLMHRAVCLIIQSSLDLWKQVRDAG